MASTFSEKDLELLGYSDVVRVGGSIDTGRPWKLFDASAIAGVRNVTHRFAYFPASTSLDAAADLARQVKTDENFFVVTPKSGISVQNLKRIFGGSTSVSIFEDLIWERIQSLFSDYLQSLSQGIIREQYYVTPRSDDTKGRQDRLDSEILEYLQGKGELGQINVISAPAGVGKTTLARHVVVDLAEKYERFRLIPTFVEASHWGKLQLESVDDLWEIISNSLANFSPNLFITEDLFKHALKQGYLVFIFDGFDELCTQRFSKFNAREVLEWLIELARETEARIVVTTRTLFWEAEVGGELEFTRIRKLRPFEAPQAKDYFNKYFKDDREQGQKALFLYKQLIKQSQRPREKGGGHVQFANLPLCVGIIARYVKEGGVSMSITDQGTVIEQFLRQILERERVRQSLRTTAAEQLAAFEQVAVLCAAESLANFDIEILVAAGFSESDMPKLGVHPFLSRVEPRGYTFSYAFLQSYLLASTLAKSINKSDINDPSIQTVMIREANGKGHVIEHLVELLEFSARTKIGDCYRSSPLLQAEVKSFLFHLLKALAESSRENVSAADRTNDVFRTLMGPSFSESRTVSGLYVAGKFDRLDLSGLTIKKCVFHDAEFDKCQVDGQTRFEDCRFSGDLSFENCSRKDWAGVKLTNCSMEFPTNLVWEGLQGASDMPVEEHVVDALHLALSRFWHHGRFKKSIRKNDWRKGTLGHSIYCGPVLDAMIKYGLLSEITISGVPEGGYAFSRESLPDLQLFMDNRQLTGKVRTVFDALVS